MALTFDVRVNGTIEATGLTEQEYSATGLTPDTYVVEVRSDDNGTKSDWSQSLTVEIEETLETYTFAGSAAPSGTLVEILDGATVLASTVESGGSWSTSFDEQPSELPTSVTVRASASGFVTEEQTVQLDAQQTSYTGINFALTEETPSTVRDATASHAVLGTVALASDQIQIVGRAAAASHATIGTASIQGPDGDLRFVTNVADDDGYQYQVRILKSGFSADPTELIGASPAFDIALGRNSPDPLWRPIEESSAQIRVIDDDRELAEVFDSGKREYPVVIQRRPSEAAAYEVIWRGFLRPDFYQDDPHNRSVAIVEAIDGLALLKNEQANLRLAPESYASAVRRLLSSIGYDLPIHYALDYYPEAIESGWIGDELDVRWEGLGDMSAYEALRSLMAAFGAQLKQSRGAWHIETRSALARGAEYRRIETGGSTETGTSPYEVRVVDHNIDSYASPSDAFRSELATVTVNHSHEEVPNLLGNAGFESGESATDIDAWELIQPDDGGSSVERVSWDTSTVKEARQENQWALEARRRAGGAPYYDGPILRQIINTRLQRGRGELRIEFVEGREDFTSEQRFRLRLEAESGHYVHAASAVITDSFLGSDGDSGKVSIEAVSAGNVIIAPEGARLPIRRPNNSLNAHDAIITLSEPWRGGDTMLRGEVDRAVNVSAIGDVRVYYYAWLPQSGAVPAWQWPVPYGFTAGTSDREDEAQARVRRQLLRVPMSTPTGEPVGGSLAMELEMVTSSTSSLPVVSFFDDFEVQPLIDGRDIESTSVVVATEAERAEMEASTSIADAPFTQSLKGFRVDDTAIVVIAPGGGDPQVIYDKETNITGNWRLGLNGPATGLPLIDLVGRETLRTERKTLPMLQRAASTRPDKAGDIWPATAIEDSDGALYTIGRYVRKFGAGGGHVISEMALLEDFGVDEIAFALSQDSAHSLRQRPTSGTTVIGTSAFQRFTDVPKKVGAFIEGPFGVNATQFVLPPFGSGLVFVNPVITGRADAADSATFEVRINASTVGVLSVASSGTVSTTVDTGTVVSDSDVLTLRGPTTSADITWLSLFFHLGGV